MKRKPYAEICLVVLGTALYFMANLQRVAIPGAFFDMLAQDLKATAHAVTTLGSVFMYSYAFGQLVIGVLVARFGGFRVVTVGSILFFVGSLIFPYAHSLPLLYISRLLIGLGSASFYLGLINESRRLIPNKNYGVILSFILLIGYLGGIVANAPLVICAQNLGWRGAFVIAGGLTALIACLFIFVDRYAEHVEIDKSVHMDFNLFKETFKNKKNLYIYAFACLNYGLYYAIQTVIGKKFLEDFCQMPVIQAATILSVMAFMYAIAGSVIAFLSRLLLNRKIIFLKIAAINTLIVFGFILLCICFNYNSPLIGVCFCSIAFCASLSPLLIILLNDCNNEKVVSTAISIMPCGFYLVVAVLASTIGFCLDLFIKIEHAYTAIFTIMFILAVFSFVNALKIEESKKTTRLIEHINYIKEQSHQIDS